MTHESAHQESRRRRGFGSVIAVILLSIASIVIVGLATPGADRAMQSTHAIDSIRAGLAADAGVAIAAAALTTGAEPIVPTQYAADYDVEFEDVEDAGVRTVTITARHGAATRVIAIEIETD